MFLKKLIFTYNVFSLLSSFRLASLHVSYPCLAGLANSGQRYVKVIKRQRVFVKKICKRYKNGVFSHGFSRRGRMARARTLLLYLNISHGWSRSLHDKTHVTDDFSTLHEPSTSATKVSVIIRAISGRQTARFGTVFGTVLRVNSREAQCDRVQIRHGARCA